MNKRYRYIVNKEDLLQSAQGNVYNTEYSTKINISVKNSVLSLFKEIKKQFNDELGIKVNNAKLFEMMVIEMYNTNKNIYK